MLRENVFENVRNRVVRDSTSFVDFIDFHVDFLESGDEYVDSFTISQETSRTFG